MHHGRGLRRELQRQQVNSESIDSLIRALSDITRSDYSTCGFSNEDQAMLAYARKLTDAPATVTAEDVMALREARDILVGALPDEPAHGTILKAGLPKGFSSAGAPMAAE